MTCVCGRLHTSLIAHVDSATCVTYDRLSIHCGFVHPRGRGVRATRLRTLVDGPYRDDEAAGASFMHELFSGMALALGIALHSHGAARCFRLNLAYTSRRQSCINSTVNITGRAGPCDVDLNTSPLQHLT